MKLSKLLPARLRHRVYAALEPHIVRRLPDRRFMEQRIVPALAADGAKRVLFVGCRSYTEHYPAVFARHGMELWTCDIDPEAARFGAAGRHRTIDVCKVSAAHFPVRFDAIVFSGVVGFGVDEPAAVHAALRALSGLLRSKGRLVLGWNSDRSADPLGDQRITELFTPRPLAGVPVRARFETVTHVYDFLAPTPVQAASLARAERQRLTS